jgi:hypothetical protein
VWLCDGTSADLMVHGAGRVDVAFHSLVRHHLDEEERGELDAACAKVAACRLEYDGFRHWAHPLVMSALCWREPAFLAAAIFSYLRYPSIFEVRRRGQQVRCFINGCYLAETVS